MSDRRDTIIAWSAGVSAVAATFAGVLASRATTPLSQNGWFLACVAVACTAFALLVATGLAALPMLLRKPKSTVADRGSDPIETARRPVNTRRELPKVSEVDDRALLGIHPAIPLSDENLELSREFPTYVRRDIDPELDDWVAKHLETGGFLLLVGPAAVGKTRTAYELLRRTVASWRIFMPSSAIELAEHMKFVDDDRPLVVWLNETQRFLGPDGIEPSLLRRMLVNTRPILVIGTIWPDLYESLTDPFSGLELADPGRDAREILGMLADRRDLFANFTADEYQRALVTAQQDPRIEEAIKNGRDVPLAAMLAGAPELIRRWVTATNPYGSAVLSSAVFANICGHPDPIPVAVLKSLVACFLSSEQRARLTDPNWFNNALDWCVQPIRGNLAPLVPQSETIGNVDGYSVSDVLVQHGRSDARITSELDSESAWLHLVAGSSPNVCAILSVVAFLRPGPFRVFKEAGVKAAESGDIPSMLNLGTILYQRGDTEEADFWLAKAAATNNPVALTEVGKFLVAVGRASESEELLRNAATLNFPPAMDVLSDLLNENGDAAESESWMRKAAALGYPPSMTALAMLLHYRGEGEEGEEWARKAAQAGDIQAIAFLGIILSERGEKAEAEGWLRKAASFNFPNRTGTFGHPIAITELGSILLGRGDREEAELWWRRSAAGGENRARTYLGTLLMERDEVAEAVALWLKAAEDGSELGAYNLGTYFYESGNMPEAEHWWRQAAEAEMPMALQNLAVIASERGDRDEAEDWWRKAAEAKNANAMNVLAGILAERGEGEKAEVFWRRAIEAGDTFAVSSLASYYYRNGLESQAETWWRKAADAGDMSAAYNIAVILLRRGDDSEAMTWLRKGAEANYPKAMFSLGALLEKRRQLTEAELWTRKAIESGHSGAMSNMGAWLLDQGKVDEAEPLLRRSAGLGNSSGMYNLGELLYRGGEKTEAERWRQEAMNTEPGRDWPEYTD